MTAINTFDGFPQNSRDPLEFFEVVTPSDTDELVRVSRAIHLEVAGDLAVVDVNGNTHVIPGLTAGWHPIRVRQIRAAGTTATGIFAGS